jgi:hypothetical protein
VSPYIASFSCCEQGIVVMSFVWVEEPHCTVGDNKCKHILLPDNAPSKYTRGFLRAF